LSTCQLHISLTRTAQIYLELHFRVEPHTKKALYANAAGPVNASVTPSVLSSDNYYSEMTSMQAIYTETDRQLDVDQGTQPRVVRQELRHRLSVRRAAGWTQS